MIPKKKIVYLNNIYNAHIFKLNNQYLKMYFYFYFDN